jgi:hypothetical protein
VWVKILFIIDDFLFQTVIDDPETGVSKAALDLYFIQQVWFIIACNVDSLRARRLVYDTLSLTPFVAGWFYI